MAFVVLEIPPNVAHSLHVTTARFHERATNWSVLVFREIKSIKCGLKWGKKVHKKEDKELFKISEHSWEMHATLNAQHPVLDSLSVNKGSFSSL